MDASEINRNFDDLYATINALNSENMDAAYDHASSQITIVDTASNYAFTEVEAAMGEPTSLQRGLHTLHVVPQATNAIIVFPGKVEIGGQICVVSTKFTVSGVTVIDSGTVSSYCWMLAGQPAAGEELTASDIFLIERTSITTSSCFDISAMGYYYDSKRLVGAAINKSTHGTCQNLINWFNPDPVQKAFHIWTYESGVIGNLFGITQAFQASAPGADTTYIWNLHVFYDMDFGAYGYSAEVHYGSACSTQVGIGTGSVPYDVFWTLSSMASVYSSTAITNTIQKLQIDVHISECADAELVQFVLRPVPYVFASNH